MTDTIREGDVGRVFTVVACRQAVAGYKLTSWEPIRKIPDEHPVAESYRLKTLLIRNGL